MKTCNKCKSLKSLDNFGNNRNSPDGKQPYCLECSKAKDQKHYLCSKARRARIRQRNEEARNRYREWIFDYLQKHPCVDCGETDVIVLDFDHRENKTNNVTSMVHCSIEKLEEEVAKCDIRCANCHRRKTAKEEGFYRYLRIVEVPRSRKAEATVQIRQVALDCGVV